MPKFLEDRLRSQAANKGLSPKQADRYVYGAMNNLGAMHGSVETAKGQRMDAKHSADMKAGKARQGKQTQSSMPSHVRSAGHPGRNLGAHLHPRKSR